MKNFISAWLPVFMWTLVIFLFSSLSSVETPFLIWWDVLIKKTAHLIEYAILAILLFRALRMTYENRKSQSSLLQMSGILSSLYAVSDEIHQGFTPGRTPTVRDVIIDIIGITLALFLVKKLNEQKKKIPLLSEFIFEE